MALSSKDFQRELSSDSLLKIVRENTENPSIEPSSVDLHLGKYIGRYDRNNGPVKVWDEETYPEYKVTEHENPVIAGGEFLLAHTKEYVEIPPSCVGFLHGRSSVGRLGLFIHNAGLVDAGFQGELTLELYNPQPWPIVLKEDMRICQMTVHMHDSRPDVPYSPQNNNKYQGQEGATPSSLYQDFENDS
jgi:dCTP deaminase